MFGSLKLQLIIAGIIIFAFAICGGVIYFQNQTIKNNAATQAALQSTIVSQGATIKSLKQDAADTKINTQALFDALTHIHTEADTAKNKIVIPAKVLHDKDSSALTKLLNEQTAKQLKNFEDITKIGKP